MINTMVELDTIRRDILTTLNYMEDAAASQGDNLQPIYPPFFTCKKWRFGCAKLFKNVLRHAHRQYMERGPWNMALEVQKVIWVTMHLVRAILEMTCNGAIDQRAPYQWGKSPQFKDPILVQHPEEQEEPRRAELQQTTIDGHYIGSFSEGIPINLWAASTYCMKFILHYKTKSLMEEPSSGLNLHKLEADYAFRLRSLILCSLLFQFAPPYHDYVLYSNGGGGGTSKYRAQAFAPTGQEMDTVETHSQMFGTSTLDDALSSSISSSEDESAHRAEVGRKVVQELESTNSSLL
eukprot:Gb_09501 [translate_table: standard]